MKAKVHSKFNPSDIPWLYLAQSSLLCINLIIVIAGTSSEHCCLALNHFLYLVIIAIFNTVKRCDDGTNGGCAKGEPCIQQELTVNCSCDYYNVSEEDNMLARGEVRCYKQLFPTKVKLNIII